MTQKDLDRALQLDYIERIKKEANRTRCLELIHELDLVRNRTHTHYNHIDQ